MDIPLKVSIRTPRGLCLEYLTVHRCELTSDVTSPQVGTTTHTLLQFPQSLWHSGMSFFSWLRDPDAEEKERMDDFVGWKEAYPVPGKPGDAGHWAKNRLTEWCRRYPQASSKFMAFLILATGAFSVLTGLVGFVLGLLV